MTGARTAPAAVAAALLAMAACTPPPAPAGGPDASAPAASAAARVGLTGTVAVSAGPAGRDLVTLRPDEARAVGLVGPLAEELREVDGARASVAGRAVPGTVPAAGGALEVESYELLAIDGERPAVGMLRVAGGGAMLVTGDGSTVRLAGAPPALLARAGAKVWVTGRTGSDGLAVTSYGVLRAP